jgi:hypothetical protein
MSAAVGVNENLMKASVVFNVNGTLKKSKPGYNMWRGHTAEELEKEYAIVVKKDISIRGIHPTLQKRYVSLVRTFNLLKLEKKYVDPNSLKRTRARAAEYTVGDQVSWTITIEGVMENIEREIDQIRARSTALRAADKAAAAAEVAAAAAADAKKAADDAAAVLDDWESLAGGRRRGKKNM